MSVIIVAKIIDHETVKDFGFVPFIADLNNYMEIVTGVITVAENNDNETVYDFGLESSVEDQMMTGAITAAGNIDHDTVMDIGIESFVGDLNSDDEFAVAVAAVMVTGRNNFAYIKNQIDAGSKWAPTKRWTC